MYCCRTNAPLQLSASSQLRAQTAQVSENNLAQNTRALAGDLHIGSNRRAQHPVYHHMCNASMLNTQRDKKHSVLRARPSCTIRDTVAASGCILQLVTWSGPPTGPVCFSVSLNWSTRSDFSLPGTKGWLCVHVPARLTTGSEYCTTYNWHKENSSTGPCMLWSQDRATLGTYTSFSRCP